MGVLRVPIYCSAHHVRVFDEFHRQLPPHHAPFPQFNNSSLLFYEYNIVENSSGQEINFFYEHENGEVLFFKYTLPRKGFLLKLDVQSQGYSSLLNRSSDIDLNWTLSSLKNSKSQDYENRYTYLNYQDKDLDVRDLSAYSDDDDIDSAKWISYGQHFFNTILI